VDDRRGGSGPGGDGGRHGGRLRAHVPGCEQPWDARPEHRVDGHGFSHHGSGLGDAGTELGGEGRALVQRHRQEQSLAASLAPIGERHRLKRAARSAQRADDAFFQDHPRRLQAIEVTGAEVGRAVREQGDVVAPEPE